MYDISEKAFVVLRVIFIIVFLMYSVGITVYSFNTKRDVPTSDLVKTDYASYYDITSTLAVTAGSSELHFDDLDCTVLVTTDSPVSYEGTLLASDDINIYYVDSNTGSIMCQHIASEKNDYGKFLVKWTDSSFYTAGQNSCTKWSWDAGSNSFTSTTLPDKSEYDKAVMLSFELYQQGVTNE